MSRILFVLCYYDNRYIRNRNLVSSLKLLSEHDVICQINHHTGLYRYWETLAKLLLLRLKGSYDYIFLGFRGHEIYALVRVLFPRTSIVFDSLVSPYDSLQTEKAKSNFWRKVFKGLFVLERHILRNADLVLCDTEPQRRRLVEIFQLPEHKLIELPVSADEDQVKEAEAHRPEPGRRLAKFQVLFYGSCQPLHGVKYIIEAALQLRDLDLCFVFLLSSKENAAWLKSLLPEALISRVHIEIGFQRLVNYWIPTSQIGLAGPFGGTAQAQRVLTGKTTQFLACGLPAIVGRNECSASFKDRVNCLLVHQGDAADLASALRWAYEHEQDLKEIGESGRRLYANKFSIVHTAQRLSDALRSIG